MTDNAYVYIISPIILSVISGIGFLAKYVIGQRDKKHDEEIEERNKERQQIKDDITEVKGQVRKLQKEVKNTQAIILKCDHPDCPSKKLLAEYLSQNNEED